MAMVMPAPGADADQRLALLGSLREPEPEPEQRRHALAPVQLPGQLAPIIEPPASSRHHRSAAHARAFDRGLAQLVDRGTGRRAAEWLRDCANESRETQQALRESTALAVVAQQLREIAPEMPAEENKGRVRWRLGEARARIQQRERRQMMVHVHEDAAVRLLTRERDEAEAAMLAAEEKVLPAQIEAERCAHARAALERSTLSLGEEGAKLLRSTRALEDGEMAVWTHHQKMVADMRQAVVDAEQHKRQAASDLLNAEIGQREAIQACVLAERKAEQDRLAWVAADERLHAATFTQERADAEEGERLATIEAEESKAAFEESKASIVAKVVRQDNLEMAMGNVFNPTDEMAVLLLPCDERFARDDWKRRVQATELLNIVRAEYAVATQEADIAIKFIKVAKKRAEDGVVALKVAKKRLYDALHTPELAEATRLLPIAAERYESSKEVCKEAQAALKVVNRELRRLQQASMYATDAVVVVARQEAVAERTTRQTALSFTREIVEKKEQAAIKAEETAIVYQELKAAHELTIPPFEKACDRLIEGTDKALANKETATLRLEEAKYELAERQEDAEFAASSARSTAVAVIEPFGSLLVAITAESASDEANRAKVGQGQRLMEQDQYAEALVAFTEALEAEPPPQTADAANILELRSTCYNSLSCFEDARVDATRAQELVALADSQAGGIADVVLSIIPSDDGDGSGNDSTERGDGAAAAAAAAPDPCLEAYVAAATANLFEGICRTGSDAVVQEAMLRIMRPCADACHNRRPRDWVKLGDGRRVRWLNACQHAARTSVSSETARQRLLAPQIISAASHIELFCFIVAVFAVIRRGYQEQEREVDLMSRADLNYPTAEEVKAAKAAVAHETPTIVTDSQSMSSGAAYGQRRDPWTALEDYLRQRGQALPLRDPPSLSLDSALLPHAELSDEDKVVGRWCLQVLNRCAQTSTLLALDDAWSPKFLKHDSVQMLIWVLSLDRQILSSPVYYEQSAYLPLLAWACYDSPLLQDEIIHNTPLLENVFEGICIKPTLFSKRHVLGLLKGVAESGKEALVVQMMRSGAVPTVHALLKDLEQQCGVLGEPLDAIIVRLAAGFIKAVAAQDRPRELLFDPSKGTAVAAQFMEVLVIISSTEDSETHFECLKIAELLVGRELQVMMRMRRNLQALEREAVAQAEATAQKKENLTDLAVAGEKLEASAQRSLRNLQTADAGRSSGSFLAVQRVEDRVAENMATAGAVKASLQALYDQEDAYAAEARAREAAIHYRGRVVAEVISGCHRPLEELIKAKDVRSRKMNKAAVEILAKGDGYLSERKAYIAAQAVKAGHWGELFWQLKSHHRKMRADAMIVLVDVASVIADPTLPPVVACREAARKDAAGELHVDYAVSARLIGYLCRLQSFDTEQKQSMVLEFLLELCRSTMSMAIPNDARVLAEEVAGTMLAFVSTDLELLHPHIQQAVFDEFVRPYSMDIVVRTNYHDVSVRCILLLFESLLEGVGVRTLVDAGATNADAEPQPEPEPLCIEMAEWVIAMHFESFGAHLVRSVIPHGEIDMCGELLTIASRNDTCRNIIKGRH